MNVRVAVAAEPQREACNSCEQPMNLGGSCTNKQCSRHGRRNDYNPDAPGVAAERPPSEPRLTLSQVKDLRSMTFDPDMRSLYDQLFAAESRAAALQERAERAEANLAFEHDEKLINVRQIEQLLAVLHRHGIKPPKYWEES